LKRLKRIIKILPSGSTPNDSNFSTTNIVVEFHQDHPNEFFKYKCDVKHSPFLATIWLYLGDDARHTRTYKEH